MKPYIICHMMNSLDGRIDCEMTEKIDDTDHYYEALDSLHCDATLEGRVTLSMHYAEKKQFVPTRPSVMAGKRIYKAKESDNYAVGVDTHGSLLWSDNVVNQFGRPLIMILCEQVSTEYLEYLQTKGISYISIGENAIDLKAAMEILYADFGIKRLAVVGGGHLNGSMLDLGLIDEISMMYGYGIDGRKGMPTSFDGRPMDREPIRLTFISATEQDGIVWMQYKVNQ